MQSPLRGAARYNEGKEDGRMSKYATNKSGVIKAPKPVQKDPKASVKTGNDLRVKQGK